MPDAARFGQVFAGRDNVGEPIGVEESERIVGHFVPLIYGWG